jgi:hypothetical protein
VIDDAILRPGRFGKKHYVPLPGARERVSILKALARRTPVSSTVDLDLLAHREEFSNLTGADIASLVIYVIPCQVDLCLNLPTGCISEVYKMRILFGSEECILT